jgi:transcriptional regulator with XRE-family HTH domain
MPTLRLIRQQRCLSIQELASAAGIPRSIIFLIETGRATPGDEIAHLIAAALEVDWLTINEVHGRPPGY